MQGAGGVGEQRRIVVSHHAMLIDHECRPVISDVGILDHRHAAVVEHQPAPIQPRGGDGVVLAVDGVVHDDDPRSSGAMPARRKATNFAIA